MKAKTFDCVEMKRQGALRVHEAIKDMTVAEQVEYWRQQGELMRRRRMERQMLRQPSGMSPVEDGR